MFNNERDDQNMGEPPKVKTKKLYSFLKHSKQDSGGIASLKKDGQTVSTETDKANTLNIHFQSVFRPKTPVSLKSLAQKSLQDLHDSGVDIPFQPSPYPKMPDIRISAEVTDKLLLGSLVILDVARCYLWLFTLYSSLVILDVARCYLWLFTLYINIKIGKNSC